MINKQRKKLTRKRPRRCERRATIIVGTSAHQQQSLLQSNVHVVKYDAIFFIINTRPNEIS